MTRIVEILVAMNAVGGVLTFLGIRWGVRKARDRVKGIPEEEKTTDVTLRH